MRGFGSRVQIFNSAMTNVLTPDQQGAVQEKSAVKNQRIQRLISCVPVKAKNTPWHTIIQLCGKGKWQWID